MSNFFAGLIVLIGVVALWFAAISISAWLVSTLVSYLFDVDFGFWKAFASVLLLGVFSNVLFSGMRARSKS